MPNLERIIMTGSEGVIGTILRDKEKGLKGYNIVSVDKADVQRDNYFQADISDLKRLEEIFPQIVPAKAIIHLAGDSHDDATWESVLPNNIIGTKNIYECALKFGITKVIAASSNHVTGGYENYPRAPQLYKLFEPQMITINHPLRPDGYYGLSKIFVEGMARLAYEFSEGKIKSVCLRIGTVTPANDPTSDERHMSTYLFHEDLVQMMEKSLASKIGFGIYYVRSANTNAFWDISNAERDLGYSPKFNAVDFKK